MPASVLRHDPDLAHHASAFLPLAAPEAALARLQEALAAHDQTLEPAAPGLMRHVSAHGVAEVRLARAGLELALAADSAAGLHVLREALDHYLTRAFGPAAAGLHWQGSFATGVHPPNFRLMRVAGVEEISRAFLRVTLQGENLGAFAESGLHFRLLLPPDPRNARWPLVETNGRTVWPDGPHTLHKPVYTVSDIDPQAGTLCFDVFRHAGGRTCAWAAAARPGEEVGIIGPGGGWLVSAPWMLLAGDETALPAMRRIAAALPRTTRGRAILELADADHIESLPLPPTMELALTFRRPGPSRLVEMACAARAPEGEKGYFWFAGETDAAAAVRRHFRQHLGLPASRCRAAAYWQR